VGKEVKDFAERVKIKLPGQAEDVDQITAVFFKLRYGQAASSEDFQQSYSELKPAQPSRQFSIKHLL
jgi:hypothetical protein